ncbi:MAG: anthranilate phosphoribosyltransferase [Candidatus Obscuribacterales bacterium]|nr:anthranilate phosphoribosyltransferase [Candidatus Obscuribacterales bacterium]
MLGLVELDTILDSASSDEKILAALSALQLENLSSELLSTAIEKISAGADMHPDMFVELHEVGRYAVDCSGTGGSGISHFNTSTSVAFVLAAAGFKVAKFGGRAASGKSGSFDFLEQLGFENNLPVQHIADALSLCGLAFVYAPQVYPTLARLAPLRKKFAKPTLLNYIGPLLNPVRPAGRLMGISSDRARKIVAEYLCQDHRTNDALLVTSSGILDEIAIDTVSDLSHVKNKQVHEFQIEPQSLPLLEQLSDQLSHDLQFEFDPVNNARIFNAILSGADCKSPSYKMVVLNSAAALYMLKACSSIVDGILLSSELIAGGAVQEKVATCRRYYEQLSR